MSHASLSRCSFCNQEFKRNDSLSRHEQLHRVHGGVLELPKTRSSRACDACASQKARCSGDPCARCTRLQLFCTFDRPSKRSRRGSGPSSRAQLTSMSDESRLSDDSSQEGASTLHSKNQGANASVNNHDSTGTKIIKNDSILQDNHPSSKANLSVLGDVASHKQGQITDSSKATFPINGSQGGLPELQISDTDSKLGNPNIIPIKDSASHAGITQKQSFYTYFPSQLYTDTSKADGSGISLYEDVPSAVKSASHIGLHVPTYNQGRYDPNSEGSADIVPIPISAAPEIHPIALSDSMGSSIESNHSIHEQADSFGNGLQLTGLFAWLSDLDGRTPISWMDDASLLHDTGKAAQDNNDWLRENGLLSLTSSWGNDYENFSLLDDTAMANTNCRSTINFDSSNSEIETGRGTRTHSRANTPEDGQDVQKSLDWPEERRRYDHNQRIPLLPPMSSAKVMAQVSYNENFVHTPSLEDASYERVFSALRNLQSVRPQEQLNLEAFPTKSMLNTFIQTYFEHVQPPFPVLHATFDPQKTHWLLIICVASVGCCYTSLPNAHAIAVFLNELVRRGASFCAESDNHCCVELWYIQALLLCNIQGTFSGNARHFELAEILRSQVLTHYRRLRSLMDKRLAIPIADVKGGIEAKWKHWRKKEEIKRLGVGCHLYDSYLTIFFDSPPSVSIAELNDEVPCDERLWAARTARSWWSLYCQMNSPGVNQSQSGGSSTILASMQQILARKHVRIASPFTSHALSLVLNRFLWERKQNRLCERILEASSEDASTRTGTEEMLLDDTIDKTRQRYLEGFAFYKETTSVTLNKSSFETSSCDKNRESNIDREFFYHFANVRQLIPLRLLQILGGKRVGPNDVAAKEAEESLRVCLTKSKQALTQFRLAVWHSAQLMRIVEHHHKQRPYESTVAFTAALVLRAAASMSQELDWSSKDESTSYIPTLDEVIHLSDAIPWIQGRSSAKMRSVGLLHGAQGRYRVLLQSARILEAHKVWAISHSYVKLLLHLASLDRDTGTQSMYHNSDLCI